MKKDAQKLEVSRALQHARLCTKTYRDFGSFLGSSNVRPFYEVDDNTGRKKQMQSIKDQESILQQFGSSEKKTNRFLDPVVFKDPASITHAPPNGPVLYGDDGKKFTIIRDDGYDAEIKQHFFVSSEGELKKLEGGNVHGTKIAYYFYGKTGSTPGNEDGRDTYMGTAILEPGSIYHLDVGFKGSRSGRVRPRESARGKGNADWATDVSSQYMIENPAICEEGHVAYGFAEAYSSCINPLATICADAHKRAKEHVSQLQIETTGHSLGGALSTNFWSAMHFGTFKETVIQHEIALDRAENQPIDKNKLTTEWNSICENSRAVTFSAPPTHGKDALLSMAKKAPHASQQLMRIYTEDDQIPKGMGTAAKLFFSGKSEGIKKALAEKKIVEDMKAEHVTSETVSLGKIVHSVLPSSIVFLTSGGVAHMHSVNEARIKEILKIPVDLTKATWTITDAALNPINEKSQTATVLLPEEYASLAAKINFEDELTLILATLDDKATHIVRNRDIVKLLKLIKRTEAVGGEIMDSSIGKIIPGLIDLERDLKSAPDKTIYHKILTELQQVDLALKDMVKANPEATALQAVSQNIAVLCACHTKSNFQAIKDAYLHVVVNEGKFDAAAAGGVSHEHNTALQMRRKLQQIQFLALVDKYQRDTTSSLKDKLFPSKDHSEESDKVINTLNLISAAVTAGKIEEAEETWSMLEWELSTPQLITIYRELKNELAILAKTFSVGKIQGIQLSRWGELTDHPEVVKAAHEDDETSSLAVWAEGDEIEDVPVIAITRALEEELLRHLHQLEVDDENVEGSSAVKDEASTFTIKIK